MQQNNKQDAMLPSIFRYWPSSNLDACHVTCFIQWRYVILVFVLPRTKWRYANKIIFFYLTVPSDVLSLTVSYKLKKS